MSCVPDISRAERGNNLRGCHCAALVLDAINLQVRLVDEVRALEMFSGRILKEKPSNAVFRI